MSRTPDLHPSAIDLDSPVQRPLDWVRHFSRSDPGKIHRQRAVRATGNQAEPAQPTISQLLAELWAIAGERKAPKGEAVILVTNKDGTVTAINVDRIERVEANAVSQSRESNIFLVGGGRLTVAEPPEVIIDQIVEAKARVVARSFSLSPSSTTTPDTSIPPLRIVPPETIQS